MKWRSLLFFIPLLAGPLMASGDAQYFDIKDFHCGLDSYHSSLTIGDCYVQDAQNVYFDQDAGVVKRQGFTIFGSSKSYSYSGAWQYTDAGNQTWMIVRSSDTIMATTNGTFSVKIATISSTDIVSQTNAFGNSYFVDQTQGVYYWNGTSTTYVSGSPQGSIIENFHGRIWVSGLQVPRGNYLYGSKYLDGTVWTTGSGAADPVLFQVGLSDNIDILTSLYVYLDTMYIFKTKTIHALYGFDQTNFQISILNTEVGCIDPGSIQAYQGGLVFMSQRGLESFNGYRSERISTPVKNLIDPAALNTFSQRSYTQTSQAEFQSGTILQAGSLSTAILPGTVIISSYSIADSTTQFAGGTFSSTTLSGAAILISTNTAEILEPSFESGIPSSNWTENPIPGSGGWDEIVATATVNCTTTPKDGSLMAAVYYGLPVPYTINAEVFDALNGTSYGAKTFDWNSAACTFVQRTITVSSSALRKLVYIDFYTDGSLGTVKHLQSSNFISNSRDVTFWSASDTNAASRSYTFIDLVAGTPRSTITQGTFVSAAQDTGFLNTYTYVNSVSSASNTGAIAFGVQTATGSAGPWSETTVAVGISAATRRYVRYNSTWTLTSADAALSALSNVNYYYVPSSGTYYSPVINQPNLTTWGNFIATKIDSGGSHAFFVRSGTNPFTMTMATPTWVSQSVNSLVSASTGTYFQIADTFTVTNATHTPTLSDFSITWNEGTRRPRMSSIVYDDRYWITLTTTTADTANEAIIVMSKGPIFTKFSHHAGALLVWKNAPYHADSDSTGKVYADNLGYNDNGGAIDAYIKTKDFAPGGIISDKIFDNVYIIGDNLGRYGIYTSYAVDRTTTTFNLGDLLQDETPGTLISKLNFPLDVSHQVFGKMINFRIRQNDVDVPMKLYGASLRFHPRPPQ